MLNGPAEYIFLKILGRPVPKRPKLAPISRFYEPSCTSLGLALWWGLEVRESSVGAGLEVAFRKVGVAHVLHL